MIDPVLFAGFLAATALIVCIPGPSCALASAQAVRYGPRAAMVTVAGDALGSAFHIVIATASLHYLVALADEVLPWLQIAGGLYILWLAYQAFTAPEDHKVGGHRASFLSGFFACVTNPKAIVFFAALFPGFISPDHSIWVQSLIYGAVFILLDAASIIGFALAALRALHSPLGQRVRVTTLSGIGLTGVGGLLVFKGCKALTPQ